MADNRITRICIRFPVKEAGFALPFLEVTGVFGALSIYIFVDPSNKGWQFLV